MWVKLSEEKRAEIVALSETNPGPHFVAPVQDAEGAWWIGSDVLGEPLFEHYAPALDGLAPTPGETPVWPTSDENA